MLAARETCISSVLCVCAVHIGGIVQVYRNSIAKDVG